MANPLQITDQKMFLMVKAGMWRIDIGAESGSDNTKRQIFNRPANNKSIINAGSIINNYPGIVVYYFFIIGNPYEQGEDLLQTINLLRNLPSPFFIRSYNLVFIPGTHLFNRACLEGIILGIDDSGFEIDFLAGFDPKGYKWKERNLYLNSVISLMTGKSTQFRIGLLPKKVIPVLVASHIIRFCDRYIIIGKALTSLGKTSLRIRRAGLILATNMFKDNNFVYDMRFLFKRRK
jgi:hypothetical protein